VTHGRQEQTKRPGRRLAFDTGTDTYCRGLGLFAADDDPAARSTSATSSYPVNKQRLASRGSYAINPGGIMRLPSSRGDCQIVRLCVVLIAVGLFVPLLAPQVFAQTSVPSLNRQTIKLGEGLLVRSVYFHDKSLGTVTDLIADPMPHAKLGVAGLGGAVYLKADRSVAARVEFATFGRGGFEALFSRPSMPTHVQFVRIDKRGTWGFLNRGGEGWQDCFLIGADGQIRWRIGGDPAVDDADSGDLDGDGVADFVVGFNGDGGVRRVDVAGKSRWQKKDANVWHVAIVDTDGDGKPEIVHTSASGEITVRDPDGNVVRHFRTAFYCSEFSLCRWPTSKSAPKLLVRDGGALGLVDLLGGVAGRFPVPAGKRSRGSRAAVVRLKRGEQPHLAVLAAEGSPFLPTTNLLLFNAQREVVYQEEIGGKCGTIAVMANGDAGLDDFLVGGLNTVWKYSPAK
jgi:hypothetical protein